MYAEHRMLELALHVLDILQNIVEADATRVILLIDEDHPSDRLTISVTDNGRGMDDRIVARVTDSLYTTRTTRHFGLGLLLYAMAAGQAGGRMTISSQPGVGTTVQAVFQWGHRDRQPLGDMADTLLAFLLSERALDLRYEHRERGDRASESHRVFEFDTVAIRAELEGLSLNHPVVAHWLAGFLAEGETQLCRSSNR